MRLVADIETNGLLRQEEPQIHCLVTQDLDTGQVIRYDDSGKHLSISAGISILMEADEIWGHNWIGFDAQFIREVYPWFVFAGNTFDTLILSRLFFTDMLDRDFRSKPAGMPGNLFGRHSLESWGHRLNCHKSEFGKSLGSDWSTYSPEMLEYCVKDVEVSVKLAGVFIPKLEQYKDCIETEHHLADVMAWQEREGWPFDVDKAHQLESKLRIELDALSDEMRSTFYFVEGSKFTPKRDNKTQGYYADCEMTRLKEFSPTSRAHIAWCFQTFRGWNPREFSDTGRPKIDEKILQEIGTPESIKFARILELQKHLGQLSEGTNAWLKQVTTKGRIHHSCVLNTNTGRQVHLRPNLAQVPSAPEYRELFYPGKGRTQVAADASGLELRCLAHVLHPYDQGAFAKEVVEGDIHTALANIYSTDRKSGKGVTYCLIYGGGDIKLGLTAGASKSQAASKGKAIRKAIMTDLTGFAELSAAIKERAQSGVLKGLDGRPIRLQGKPHASLNYILQSMGACICKSWLLRTNELLLEAKIDYWPLGFIHDEIQLSVHPGHAKQAAFLMTAAMKDVEHSIKFRCQLDSEAVIGSNWAECH